jgi:tRNA (guanine26-N2/guanine27-N2)-dimethyltransferase
MHHQERKAQFQVDNAFYNPASQKVRDLGVLAAAVYRQEVGSLRVLDGMAGCGVRSLRYYLESQADWIWANEANQEVVPVVRENLQGTIPATSLRLTHQDANRIFFECYNQGDYYDLVDIDCFGTATPYLSTVLWATKLGGLVYLTATDGRSLTGHLPGNSLKAYGAYTRTHPASQEQALRILLGSVQQQAATKGFGIQPIFSYFTGRTYRLMVQLHHKPRLSENNYGFLGYCHGCGDYQTVSWRKLGKALCPHDQNPLTLTGAMWLGALHSPVWLEKMLQLAQNWGWTERVKLLTVMIGEIDFLPYHYTLGEIGRRGKMDLPKRDRALSLIIAQGYRATPTHLNPQAIKTNASLATCIKILRNQES